MPVPERIDLRAPEEVRRIARRLQDAGYSTWAVGGAVRDAIAGIPPGDWDLTTSARPEQVRALFRRTVPVGIEHGTVGVLGRDGKLYEVTTFRRDVETDGRRARVAFSASLEEDLERRDFTINAVAWDPIAGVLADPHGGVDDLRVGVLRTVGEPALRFAEDRLRVLRAMRFAGRFELRIEEHTWQAIRDSAGALSPVSAERIREELYKTLASVRLPSLSLDLYRDSGVLAHVYPELAACVGVQDEHGTDLWDHLVRTADALPRSRPILRLAALMHDVGKAPDSPGGELRTRGHPERGAALARVVLKRLKASNAVTDRVVHLVAQHSHLPPADAPDPDFRRWLRRAGREHYRDLIRLRVAICRARGSGGVEMLAVASRVRQIAAEHPALSTGDLALRGQDLRRLGVTPGPRYGEILHELLERVTDQPELNTREALEEIVRRGLTGTD
jgi:tRNA nucleotidyltransferase (CCA-adding enzyme)